MVNEIRLLFPIEHLKKNGSGRRLNNSHVLHKAEILFFLPHISIMKLPCPALATQLLIYLLVTPVCIGLLRSGSAVWWGRPALRFTVTDEGSSNKCSQRCAPGQHESWGVGLGG